MFIILTYDVNAKRVSKVMKICRKYLTHIQRSVFEGMITESKLGYLKRELRNVIIKEEDQICIYKMESLKYTCKEEIGSVNCHSNII